METQLPRFGSSPRVSRRTLLLALTVGAAGGLLVGCAAGGPAITTGAPAAQVQTSGQTQTTASAASSAPATVKMTDQYKYDPATITIPKGTTVEWHNTSASPHTVTDDPAKAATKSDAELPSGAEAWDSGMIDPGQTYRQTFTVPGEYSYFCVPHESMGMVGKIIVQ